MVQPVNESCQDVGGSPGRGVLQEAKTAPVSHEVVENGTWDVIEVGRTSPMG